MIIGGFQKISLIDYPGKICAIIFTTGCNFRCSYCHNPELVLPDQYASEISLEEIYAFLRTRQDKIDAVTITGGEPTLHDDLIQMIEKIKEMGFLIKLDSNGSNYEALQEIVRRRLVDYIAMDIKAPLEDYEKIVGWQVPVKTLKKSIRLIMSSGVEYEFRTTIVKSLTSKKDLEKIAQTIKGADNYYLQGFIPTKLNDPRLMKESSYSYDELRKIATKLEKQYVKHCGVRKGD